MNILEEIIDWFKDLGSSTKHLVNPPKEAKKITRWTTEEVENLVAYKTAGYTDTEISKLLNRTESSVSQKYRSLQKTK